MREAASFIAIRSSGSPQSLLAAGLGRLGRALESWAGRRRLMRLGDLDDHVLHDIGITRDDVAWALELPWETDAVHQLQLRRARRRAAGWRECR